MRTPLRSIALILVLAGAFAALSCGDGDGGGEADFSGEWPTLSANIQRTGANLAETRLTKETASKLAVKWKFETEAPVAASPVVATVDVPGEGAVRLVVVGSYDGNVYAVRASDGEEAWRFAIKPHPGVSYGLIASTATIAQVDGEQRVYIGGGETMYGLDAGTGEKLWEFDAGTGCTTCDDDTERNEILSSPAVVPEQDLVLFGMDVDDRTPGKGGFYALSARDGRLRWYFDVTTGATCRPNEDEKITRFDGYHTAEELGLPADFFSTREGCDFDRSENACGSVWSPVSADLERELLYFTSANCDTDDDPSTPKPPPPMPLYDDAIVALRLDGTPAWTWRPRDVDTEDFDFGAGPNIFTATIEGEDREVVGVGGKDGTYYLLDRDGENEITGRIEPYWQQHVVEGSDIGGITGTAAVVGDRIYFATAISEGPPAWALAADDGTVVWSQPEASPYYGATSAVPGVVFMGGINTKLHAYDGDTGEVLFSLGLESLVFSSAAIVDGEVFIGSGFGALGAGPEQAQEAARVPGAVWALCIAGEEGCEDATPRATP